jgi:hypothetical protein
MDAVVYSARRSLPLMMQRDAALARALQASGETAAEEAKKRNTAAASDERTPPPPMPSESQSNTNIYHGWSMKKGRDRLPVRGV